MAKRRAPRPLYLLGALLVVYFGYPVGSFLYRVATGSNEGWHAPGLWSALRVSAEGATLSLLLGVLFGIPLAYLLARSRGPLAAIVGVIVQLPLAVPPLISGILLIYIVGPYTFLGQHSGERLTQTFWGVVIAQTFVSIPFLVVVARSAFRAVDPALADMAATLGHGRLARFLRVDTPAAADGIRAGMVLMWLRAFGEYGTVVVLAYHPYSLPVYVENLFSSAPLTQTQAPTLLAFGVAALAILVGHLKRPPRLRKRRLPAAQAPVTGNPTAVGFDLNTRVGGFRLQVAHPERAHRLAIVGPSGSGKSVTLRAVAGLLGPRAGAVSYAGSDVSRTAPERRHIGYVPQGFGLMPGRSVWKQVTFGVHADPGRAAWWLRTLGIAELCDRVPEQLSGGQRQRVSLARALAVDPQLLLLDEPFSALDAPVRAELRRELRRLQLEVNLSTVVVTHDPEEAAMLADEVIVVADGQVLQAGRCREVYQRPASIQVGRLLGIENLFEGTPPVGSGSMWHVPPEALSVTAIDAGPAAGTVALGEGLLLDVIDLGRSAELVVALTGGQQLRARSLELPELTVGRACRVSAGADAICGWDHPAPESSATPASTQ